MGDRVKLRTARSSRRTVSMIAFLIAAATMLPLQARAQEMVLIPAGTFIMGSPPDEPGRSNSEIQHQVALTRAICVSKYEVTQSEWQSAMGWNESHYPGANHPVEMVTWYDAVSYCNQRSADEGLPAAYTITDVTYIGNNIYSATVTWNQAANGYRLLTEAEWEYACRATSTTAFCNGGITVPWDCAPLDPNLDQVGWYSCNSTADTRDVGGKTANAWGLKDMHGNVWEWCWNWWEPYSTGSLTDPTGPASGTYRIIRGGSRSSGGARWCRSAQRSTLLPGTGQSNAGLRVCRNSGTLYHYCDKRGNQTIPEPVLLRPTQWHGVDEDYQVCADSSTASLFGFRTNGADPNNLVLTVKEDVDLTQRKRYGGMEGNPEVIAPDSVVFRYHHPWQPPPSDKQYESATLQVYDTVQDMVLLEVNLRIYRAPVTLVHGWTGEPMTMNGLKDGLFATGNWDTRLVYTGNYFIRSVDSAYSNRDVVPTFINTTLMRCGMYGIAAGKSDVIGHSMGGILARLYLQSAWGDGVGAYRGDMFRLITVDTPHLGSQAADLAKEAIFAYQNETCDGWVRGLGAALLKAENTMGPAGWFTGDAAEDLRVHSPAIHTLNVSSLNRATVPTRVEVCVGTEGRTALEYAERFPGLEPGWAGFVFGILTAGGVDPEAILDATYNGSRSDAIVPIESQEGGGLTPVDWPYADTHSTAPSNADVIADIVTALDAWITSEYWDEDGFLDYGPSQLSYSSECWDGPWAVDRTAAPGPAALRDGGIILSPIGPIEVAPGQQIPVNLSGPPGTTALYVIAGSGGGGGAMAIIESSSGTYNLQIPAAAAGSAGLVVAASGAAGLLGLDSLMISVAPAAALTSLRIEPDSLLVYTDGQSCATVFGAYADSVDRCVNSMAGLSWWTSNPAVAQVDTRGVVSGMAPGETRLFTALQGDTASVAVHVEDYGSVVSAVNYPAPSGARLPLMLSTSPNPATGRTEIRFSTAGSERTLLNVYDVSGRHVKQIANAVLSAGPHVLEWDGRSETGGMSGSGVYFVRLQVGSSRVTGRVVLVR